MHETECWGEKGQAEMMTKFNSIIKVFWETFNGCQYRNIFILIFVQEFKRKK